MITNNKLQASRKFFFSILIGTIFIFIIILLPVIFFNQTNSKITLNEEFYGTPSPVFQSPGTSKDNSIPDKIPAVSIDLNKYEKKAPDRGTNVAEHYVERGYTRVIDSSDKNNYYYEKVENNIKKWVGVSYVLNTDQIEFEIYKERFINKQPQKMIKVEKGEIRKYPAYKLTYLNFNKTRVVETYIVEVPFIPYEVTPGTFPKGFHIISVAHSISPLEELDYFSDENKEVDMTIVEKTINNIDLELNNLVTTYRFEEATL